LRKSLSLAVLALCGVSAAEVTYPEMIHWTGTRGMSQTRSAESLGEGFLQLDATGSWYQVDKAVSGRTLDHGKNVELGTLSLGLGLGPWADASAWISGYNVPDTISGRGAMGGQIQLQAPWDADFPLRAAVQLGVFGRSQQQIQNDTTTSGKVRPDGWNYLQTRTGYDFQGTFLQTLRAGSATFPVRIHLNEGIVSSIQPNHAALILLDAGLELTPVSVFTLGLEAHSRSYLNHFDAEQDPFWTTGTFTFHLPGNANFQFGGDLRLSSERTAEIDRTALDPWRLFGSFSLGIDLLAGKRRLRREIEVRDSLVLERQKVQILEGDARAARQQKSLDSAAAASEVAQGEQQRLRADSTRLAQGLSICLKDGSSARSQVARMNDSLAKRSSQDSAALAEARRLIEEERLKRGDLEASFLKTGMMNLDAVYFEMGKAIITANSKPYLNLIGSILVKYPRLKFEIGGHTDNRGLPKANQKLSQSRAQAVLKHLVGANPDLASHISAKGYGSAKPKATNKTAAGREMNRRVEITVTNLEALKEYAR
jgi:outer membrane protein OmpA-like peptidoglycan-associated protein